MKVLLSLFCFLTFSFFLACDSSDDIGSGAQNRPAELKQQIQDLENQKQEIDNQLQSQQLSQAERNQLIQEQQRISAEQRQIQAEVSSEAEQRGLLPAQPQENTDHWISSVPFQRIKAGTFKMGSPANERRRMSNENQVQVNISKPFEIMKHEVTQVVRLIRLGKKTLIPLGFMMFMVM